MDSNGDGKSELLAGTITAQGLQIALYGLEDKKSGPKLLTQKTIQSSLKLGPGVLAPTLIAVDQNGDGIDEVLVEVNYPDGTAGYIMLTPLAGGGYDLVTEASVPTGGGRNSSGCQRMATPGGDLLLRVDNGTTVAVFAPSANGGYSASPQWTGALSLPAGSSYSDIKSVSLGQGTDNNTQIGFLVFAYESTSSTVALHLYAPSGGGYAQVWSQSQFSASAMDWEPADLDGDGISELIGLAGAGLKLSVAALGANQQYSIVWSGALTNSWSSIQVCIFDPYSGDFLVIQPTSSGHRAITVTQPVRVGTPESGQVVFYTGPNYEGVGFLYTDDQPAISSGPFRSMQVGEDTAITLYQQNSYAGSFQLVIANLPDFQQGMRFGSTPLSFQIQDFSTFPFMGSWFFQDPSSSDYLQLTNANLATLGSSPTGVVMLNQSGFHPNSVSLRVQVQNQQLYLKPDRTTSKIVAAPLDPSLSEWVKTTEAGGQVSLQLVNVSEPTYLGYDSTQQCFVATTDASKRQLFAMIGIAPDEGRVGYLETGQIALYQNPNFWGQAWVICSDTDLTKLVTTGIGSAIPADLTGATLVPVGGAGPIALLDPKSNLAPSPDPTVKTNPVAPMIGPVFVWSVMDPEDAPLTADAVLMQDYLASGSNGDAVETTTYRTVIQPKDPGILGASPRPKIYLAGTMPLTVNIGGEDYDLDSESTTSFDFDLLGQLSVVIEAQDLTTPGLKVRMDGMPADTFLVLYPDEQIHHHLMSVTAEDVATVLPAQYQDAAGDVAAAIQNSARSVADNYTPPSQPLLSQGGVRSSHRLTLQTTRAGRPARRVSAPPSARHWKLDFSSGRPVYSTLQPSEIQEMALFTPESFFGDLWDSIVSGVDALVNVVVSAVSNVIKAVKSVVDTVIEELNVVVTFVVNGVKKVCAFVMDTAAKVFQFVGLILKKLGIDLKAVLHWLKSLFGWDDIENTQAVLVKAVNTGLTTLKQQLTSLQTDIPVFFQNCKNTIASQLSTAASQLAGKNLQQACSPDLDNPNKFASSSVQGHKVLSDTISGSSEGSVTPQNSGTLPQQLSSLITTISQQLSNQDAQDALNRATQYFTQAFDNPSQFLNLAMAGVVELMSAIAQTVISLTQAVVMGLLALASAAVDVIIKYLNEPLDIPIVSWLYENVITEGQQLTLLSASALVLAIPITLAYKLFNGGAAPFSSGGNALTAEADGRQVAQALNPKAAGWVFCGTIWVWSFIDGCIDSATAENPMGFTGETVVSAIGIGVEVILQVFSSPLQDDLFGDLGHAFAFRNSTYYPDDGAQLDGFIWVYSWIIGPVADFVSFAASLSTGSRGRMLRNMGIVENSDASRLGEKISGFMGLGAMMMAMPAGAINGWGDGIEQFLLSVAPSGKMIRQAQPELTIALDYLSGIFAGITHLVRLEE
ncbi:MAG TPA: hypothetical protein VNU49_08955 [Opitutaceae bacterium]|nr:hypothetical protein [Opitutaceae bacterium]